MITEDYVSFETAKLLKEKGFNVPCNCYGTYNGVNLTYRLCITDKYTNWNKHTDELIISCPTLQMAMKWLRTIHNASIDIVSVWNQKRFEYQVFVVTPENAKHCYVDDKLYLGYEEASEAAIKYCLENLI